MATPDIIHRPKLRSSLLLLLLQLYSTYAMITISRQQTHLSFQRPAAGTNTKSSTTTQLWLARRRPQWREEDGADREYDDISRQRSTDRPIQRQTQIIGPPIMPSKPKIVVLGASGRIGRLVVRQLLDRKQLDATIIACTKNYDKACKVLYDELSLVGNSNNKRGPQLRIIEADLVPPEELPGYLDDDEEEWRQRAESAASFYNASIAEYDNRLEAPVIVDDNEALQEAIQDCTTIISCVGSVRSTNVWSDLLARPLVRWLRPDVSGWCRDPRHPYYVQFASTRKILGYAEREQLRRETAVEMALEEEDEVRDEPIVVPKIRYIRVSDNCLSQPVWEMVPLLTNIFRSNIFRYHDMAEKLLQASTLVDTVTLRPGDLVDDERDSTSTNLQVDPTGQVETPAVVSREDVASLAVASALFKSPREVEAANARVMDAATNSNDDNSMPTSESTSLSSGGGSSIQQQRHQPFHCNLAVRWVGNDMDPYPAQGSKRDGFPTAQVALERALKVIKSSEKKERTLALRLQRERAGSAAYSALEETYSEMALRLAENFQLQRKSKTRLKPYGIVSAIPAYFVLGLALRAAWRVLWQALSSTAWAQPVVGPIESSTAALAVLFASKVRILRQFIAQWMPLALARFVGPKKYIDF